MKLVPKEENSQKSKTKKKGKRQKKNNSKICQLSIPDKFYIWWCCATFFQLFCFCITVLDNLMTVKL